MFILKDALIEDKFHSLLSIPSLNISKEEQSIKLLKKLQNNEKSSHLDPNIVSNFLEQDLNKMKYNKILSNLVDFIGFTFII